MSTVELRSAPSPATERVLVTGAAGRIGGYLRARLPRPGRTLRLLDLTTPDGVDEHEEAITASVTDLDAMVDACTGVDAVVHLGGQSGEAPWDSILATNIHGTYVVFEAARRAGVGRVVFASSNHAAGFQPATDPVPDDLPARPDTYYGVSKVTGEALGSLYHDRYGLDVVCLRIGTCSDTPPNARGLATWLSPDDCGRLVEASLTCRAPGFRVVWGVSANTRRVWSLAGAHEIGYRPQDDAEVHAAEVGDRTADTDGYVGGEFAGPSFDTPG